MFAVDLLHMRGALDLLQLLLWAEGFLCLLGVPALVRIAWHQGDAPWLTWNLIYAITVAAAAPFIAWGVHRRRPWAWKLGLVHGLLQLPVLPFLSLFGFIELIAFSLPDTRRHLTEHAPGAPKLQWERALVYLGGFVWIGFCAWAGVRFLDQHRLPAWPPRHLLWVIPLLVGVDITVHELGHLAAGWWAGFRFDRVCIGPLLIHRLRDGWGVTLQAALTWDGGFAAALPTDPRRVRPNLLLFLAGGPLASFLLFAGCLMLFLTSPESRWADWAEPIGLLGAWSIVTCIVNLMPAGRRTVRTDGAWIAELASGSHAGRRHCALYAMAASEHGARRPADWHPRWIAQALELADLTPEHIAALVLAYVHYLDGGDLKRAGRLLDDAVTLQHRLPPNFVTRLLWLERTYFLAHHRGDPRSARDAWDRARSGLPVERGLLLRAECALLAAEGDTRTASELLAAARALLRSGSTSGMAAFEADRLNEIATGTGCTRAHEEAWAADLVSLGNSLADAGSALPSAHRD